MLLCAGALCSCGYSGRIKDTLSAAGENRPEIEKLLEYYEKVSPDKEKLAAVHFLVENMRFHYSPALKSRQHNLLLDSIADAGEAVLYDFVCSTPPDSLYSPSAKKKIDKAAKEFKSRNGPLVKNCRTEPAWSMLPDARLLQADELIKHIEHAFYLKNNSPFLAAVSFDDFCEYILPYRVNPHFPLIDSLAVYRRFGEKFLSGIHTGSIKDMVIRCNFIMDRMMHFMPSYPVKDVNIGYPGLFFPLLYNCIPTAHYGASFLRNAGIPIAVQFNIAHREFASLHQHCVVPDQTVKDSWLQFTPGTSVPDPDADPVFERVMNIYRFCYSEQKDSPFFLKRQDEYVYPPLNTPFIKDVSANHMPLTSVRLPFKEDTENRLAYLGTFSQPAPGGIIPVTWGKINKLRRSVVFEHVVVNRLYFPVYYTPEGRLKTFGNCFFIDAEGRRIDLAEGGEDEPRIHVLLTRKFPRKETLSERSKGLAGAYVLGANDSLMVCPDTLGYITKHPEPYLQDVELDMKKGPYRCYRLVAADKDNAALSELYYLADTACRYDNVLPAPALPILSPEDTLRIEKPLDRILDRSPAASVRLRLGDNDWSTYISTDSLNFRLLKPQYVDRIRFMPLHADNGIHPGDSYQLLYWNKTQWDEAAEVRTARYNYLEFNVSPKKLYWLRNLTKGQEELPFVIDENGRQLFIYYGFPQ